MFSFSSTVKIVVLKKRSVDNLFLLGKKIFAKIQALQELTDGTKVKILLLMINNCHYMEVVFIVDN
jgi:hypothetical protein